MIKAVKIRIYPTEIQINYLSNLFGSCRFVFNKCLSYKKQKYEDEGKNVGLSELGNYFHHDLTKNPDYVWLNEHNTKVLKENIFHLLSAYRNFFNTGKGFPKFKSKHDKQTCKFDSQAISSKNVYSDNRITLTKQLKNIKFRCSDKYKNILINNKDKIVSATLSKTKSNNYFLSILIETNEVKVLPKAINDIIGIDLGIKDFVIDSNGNKYENIKTIRSNQKKLSKLQRSISRKQKGSKNRNKERIKLAKYYEKINNLKENHLHSVSNKLINENQVIVMENLNVSGMLKNHKLAKSIQELSLNRFKTMLKYKTEWTGRMLIEVDRYFPSSKLCNNCGYKNEELELKDREWFCPNCNTKHDRDLNAAINIKKEGIRIILKDKIPNSIGELTLMESSGSTLEEVRRDDMV